MTLSRYEHVGNAVATGLASGIGATDTSFTVLSGTGYPTGSVGDFVMCIDAGTSSEEKILCSARSGTGFTVASGGRGYDGTTATSHSAGSTNVTHVLAAVEVDDDNDHIYTTTRDDHTQYLRVDGTRAGTGAQTIGGALTVTGGGAQVTGNSKVTGTLETTAALTVDAGGLTVTAGGVTVSAGGATVTGNSTVTGTLTVTSLTQTNDDAAWTAATLTNSWANYGAPYDSAGYRKVNGRVYLRGTVKSGAAGTSAFTLPAGYQPSGQPTFAASNLGSATPNIVSINNGGAGQVVIQYSSTSNQTALDGISFDTLS